MIQAKGISHRNGPVAHLKSVGIAERCHRPRSRSDQPNHRQIGHRIGTHHPTLDALPALQPHGEPIGSLHHVRIGKHQPVSLKDHPTALTALCALRGSYRSVGRQSKELPEKWVVERAPGGTGCGHGAHRVDRDHRRARPPDRRGHEGLPSEVGGRPLGDNGHRQAGQPNQPQHREAGGSGKKNAVWTGHAGRLKQ